MNRAVAASILALAIVPISAWSQANVNESLETAYIYVDTNTGSDSNPGTKQLPLKTIGAAEAIAETNNQAGIGTRVTINPGTYREAVTIAGGSQDTTLPITFEAATNGTVTVSGADVWSGWKTYSGNLNIYTNSWPYQWGLCAGASAGSSGGAPYEQNIVLRSEMIVVNGTPLTQVLSLTAMQQGTFYVDETGGTVYIWPPAGTNMKTATVEVATRPNLFTISNKQDVVLRGLTFQYANSCRGNSAVTVAGGSSEILIDTDNFNWNNSGGLGMGGVTYATIQNSVADHNGWNGTSDGELKYGLYLNDQASYNNWRGAQGAFYSWGTSGSHFNLAHDDTVQNLTTTFNETFGTHWDTDNQNITVNNYVSSQNFIPASIVELSEGPVTFSGSYFCSGNPTTGANDDGLEARNSTYITVTGSTFLNNKNQIYIIGQAGGVEVTNWETGQVYNLITQNMSLTSNIIEGGANQQLFWDPTLGGTDWSSFQTTLASDYNTWWDASNSLPFVVPSPVPSTLLDLTGWQALTGQDLHSVFQAPSGDPGAACQVTPDFPDYWFVINTQTGLVTTTSGGQATFTPSVVPLGFSGTVQLSSDGVQNIPGASASWSTQSITSSGSATFTVTTSTSTPTGVYPITLIANSGSRTRTVTVSALVNTSIAVFPPTNNFGDENLGTTSVPLTVTVVNAGTTSISLTGISVTGANAGDFTQTNTCGSSLAVGDRCPITVTFTPTAVGTRNATLTIQDADPSSPQSVSLTGVGDGVPAVTLSPTALNFGNQQVGTSSSPQTVTLTNTGSAALSITSISVAGPSFSETNTCPSSLATGASCSISVTFTPVGTGSKTGTVNITDNASPATQSASLTGTGVVPSVTLSPSSLAFGNQQVGTSSSPQQVTLTNTGVVSLSITSISVASPSFSETNTCPSSLAAGASCTISVTFTPVGIGSITGTVNITDNAIPATQSVSLTGTGVVPSVTLSPSSLAFGNQQVGTSSSPQKVTLTNTGIVSLSITSISVAGPSFSETNTCGASLAAGASCTISVTFTPVSTGSKTGTVYVTDNAIPPTQSVSLTGTGTSP